MAISQVVLNLKTLGQKCATFKVFVSIAFVFIIFNIFLNVWLIEEYPSVAMPFVSIVEVGKFAFYVLLAFKAKKIFKNERVLGWMLVSIGSFIWAPGQLYVAFLTIVNSDPFVSGSEAGGLLLVATILAISGVIAVGFHGLDTREKVRAGLNALSFGACIIFIAVVALSFIVVDGKKVNLDGQLLNLIYFAIDIMLISFPLAIILFRRFDRFTLPISLGMMFLSFSDLIYLVYALQGVETNTQLTRSVQSIALVLWVFAATRQSGKPTKYPTIQGENLLTIGVNSVVVLTIAIAAFGVARLETIPYSVSYSFLLVFVAVLVAQLVGHFENKRLQRIQSESIEEISKSEEKFQELATHDTLTDLVNRNHFIEMIKNELGKENIVEKQFSIMFVDLDRFKEVNDTYGHQAGDRVIKELAKRIEIVVGDSGLVCRLGGDEFAVLLQIDGDTGKARDVASRVLKSCTKSLMVQGTENYISCSIGIAYNTLADSDSTSLLRNADAAMYRAKELGRNRIEESRSVTQVKTAASTWTLNELHRAIAEDSIDVFYQPIIDLSNQKLVGFEALARWNHPRIGMVSPDNFISVAEDNGLIIQLGNKIIEKSFRQLSLWQSSVGYNQMPLLMNINLSFRQLNDESLIDLIISKCDEYKVSPSSVVFEMTESALLGDIKNATSTLKEIQSHGFQIQIDDFGTGYSSLSYLKKFPVSGFKIDKSYIQGYGENEDDTAIVNALVGLGKSMDLVVTAEGVDSPKTHEALVKMGCTFAQGYLYSKAIPADEVQLHGYGIKGSDGLANSDLKSA